MRLSTSGLAETSEYDDGDSDYDVDPGRAQDTGGRPWIRQRPSDPEAPGSVADSPRLSGFTEAIGGIAQSVWSSLRSVRPDTVEIEFGLDIDASTGQAVSLIADVHANSSVKVKLGWDARDRMPGAAPFADDESTASPPAEGERTAAAGAGQA
ncbi:CU044_2847 family protein [Streptomyces sp. H39-S7]|uniref:CU044_2847 family protein n=1 Tax=Streptomyces sp. H39-S7 TaxID=3004357 RepID=UPI0022AED848|nr:CU044_2847 family protein [Streptomyces sp. H39-S7]MCZ4121080.1 CU044_2847 family protein [Streptomyces sp. H39-S7]